MDYGSGTSSFITSNLFTSVELFLLAVRPALG